MPAQKIDAVVTAELLVRRNHAKRCSVLAHPTPGDAPLALVAKTNLHDLCTRACRQLRGIGIVAIQKKFSIRREQFRQRALLLRHAFEVAKKFEMLTANARDDSEARLDHLHQRRKFTGMIRARLQHRRLMRRLNPQQRVWHADVVVEAGLAPDRGEFLAQHGCDEILRRRLPVRAADRDDRQRKLPAIRRRQFAKRHPRIRDFNSGTGVSPVRQRSRCRTTPRIHHHRRNILPRDQLKKLMPIKRVAFECDEQIARLHLPRIRADPQHWRLRRTPENFPGAGVGDEVEGACVHAIPPSPS